MTTFLHSDASEDVSGEDSLDDLKIPLGLRKMSLVIGKG